MILITFSVVIPNLNSLIIQHTIASLEQQTYPHDDFEVLVVGIDKYNLIRESNLIGFDASDQPLSPAKARNRGAAKTSGEIIVFTDADCIPHADWLQMLAVRFTEPEVTVVGGGVCFQSQNYWTIADNVSMFHDYLATQPPGYRDQLPSLNLAIRRYAFDQIGGFDERYPRPSGEDSDLTIRLRYAGYKLFFEPRAMITHAPPRNRLIDLIRHSYIQGKYSTKIDSRYNEVEGLPKLIRTRLGVILFSPLLGIYTTMKIYMDKEIRHHYWKYIPPILLSKIVWCFGASQHPKW